MNPRTAARTVAQPDAHRGRLKPAPPAEPAGPGAVRLLRPGEWRWWLAAWALVAAAQPDLLVVGLGAPKQELWVHRHRHELQAKVALCVGATIDFLAGHRRRSPVWMRRAGLEWVHRMLSEPRRLAQIPEQLMHPRPLFPNTLSTMTSRYFSQLST